MPRDDPRGGGRRHSSRGRSRNRRRSPSPSASEADSDSPQPRQRRKRVRRSGSRSSVRPSMSQADDDDLQVPPSVGRGDGDGAAVRRSPLPTPSKERQHDDGDGPEAAAAAEAPGGVEQTPMPVARASTDQEAAGAVTLQLTPPSALELLQRIDSAKTGVAKHLADQCLRYLQANFAAVVEDERFVQLGVDNMQALVGGDELDATEDDIFQAMMLWVRHDPETRKLGQLDTLLRKLRSPAMTSSLPLKEDELVAQHPELLVDLLFRRTEEFQTSPKNVDSYHIRPRIGRHGYGEFTSSHPSVSILAAGASVKRGPTLEQGYSVAVCGNHVMTGGRHLIEFELLAFTPKSSLMIGVCKNNFAPETNTYGAHHGVEGWAYNCYNGCLYHDAGRRREAGEGAGIKWKGQKKAKEGDKIGLYLDFTQGSLTVFKDNQKLGVMVESGLSGELCFMVELVAEGDCVRARRARGNDNAWCSPSPMPAPAAATT